MNVPTRLLVDVLLKTTLLLAAGQLLLSTSRRMSAASRHLVGIAALAAAVALPFFAAFGPRVLLPVLPAKEAAWKRSSVASAAKVKAKADDAATAWGARDGASSASSASSDGAGRGARSPQPSPSLAAEPPAYPIGHLGFTPLRAPSSPSSVLAFLRPLARLPWALIAVSAWLAGAAACFTRFGVGAWRMRGIAERAIPVRDEEWLALTRDLSRRAGIAATPLLFHSDEVSVALTTGIRRPILILPDEAISWAPERRAMVLLHELGHVKRRDGAAILVGALATAVYWFHPLVWMLASRARRDGERACDDLVLATGARASDYAAELLAIVRSLRTAGAVHPDLPALALAESSDLEGRLRAILEPGRRRGMPSALAALLVFASITGLAATVGAVEPCAAPKKVTKATSWKRTAEVRVAETKIRIEERGDVASDGASRGIAFAGRRTDRDGSDWYDRGMKLHNRRRYDEAIEAFKKSIELGHREDAASYNIACGYALKGDKDKAFEWLGKARDEGFDLDAYLDDDDDLDALRGDARMAALDKDTHAARSEKEKRESARLVERFDRLVSSAPKDGGKLFEYGRELLNSRDYERSAKAFQAAADRGYRVSTSLYNTACALARAGDRAGALDFLEKSLEAGFDDASLVRKDRDLDSIRSEPRFAELRDLAEELKLPNHGILMKWIRTEGWNDDWREAAARYRRWLSAHPKSGRAAFNLGYVEIGLGHLSAARDALHKALDLSYRKPTTMYNLACVHARLREKDAAFDWLFKSLEAGFDGESQLEHDDDLDEIRHDPRFRKAVRLAERHRGGDDD